MSGKYFAFFILVLGFLFCSSQKSTVERKRDFAEATVPEFSGLAGVVIGPNGEVTLSWLSAQDLTSLPSAMVYEICLSLVPGGCLANFTANYTTVPGATQYTLTNLSAGVTYYAVVRARNEWGISDNNQVEKSFSVPGWFSYWGSSANNNEKVLAVASANDGYLFCLEFSVPTFNPNDFPLLAHLIPKIPYPGSSGGAKQSMVVKINLSGKAEWFSFIGQSSSVYHQCRDIAFVSDGFVVLLQVNGSISSLDGKTPINHYSGGEDILLVKFSLSGNLLWYTFWGGSQNETPEKMDILPSGKILVLGTADGPHGVPLIGYAYQGNRDALFVNFSAHGAYESHLYLGASSEQYGIALALANERVALGLYSDGNFTVNGQNPNLAHSFGSKLGFAVVVFTNNFVYNWHTFFGTNSGDVLLKGLVYQSGGWFFLAQTSQDIAVFDGKNPLVSRFGDQDMLLGRYSDAGQLQWFTYMGSVNNESAVGIVRLGDGVLVGGNCEGNIPLYLGNSPRYNFGGEGDICLFAFNSQGGLLWYSFSSLPGLDSLYYFILASQGNLLFGGSYSGQPAADSLNGIFKIGVTNKNSAIYSAGLLLNLNQEGKIR